MKHLLLILNLLAAPDGYGQQKHTGGVDPASLVGKRVNVGRLPLCQPGTYTVDLAHAGKQATVVDAKPNKMMPALSRSGMSALTPEMRAIIEDQQQAVTLLLQFDDGMTFDSCAPIGPKMLASYLDLPLEQTKSTSSSDSAAANPVAAYNNRAVQTPKSEIEPSWEAELSDEEVKAALRGDGRDHWVLIQDMGLFAAQGTRVPSIEIYMPEALLSIKSESARKQFIEYMPSPEDRQRSLTVIANGYVGKTPADGCASITRIILLSDRSGRLLKEADLSQPLEETWRNAFGATTYCQSVQAKFSLESVQKIRAAAPDGEFFIAVFAGSINTKMYKIKHKRQSKLGLN
jgi:hypothetical protein